MASEKDRLFSHWNDAITRGPEVLAREVRQADPALFVEWFFGQDSSTYGKAFGVLMGMRSAEPFILAAIKRPPENLRHPSSDDYRRVFMMALASYGTTAGLRVLRSWALGKDIELAKFALNGLYFNLDKPRLRRLFQEVAMTPGPLRHKTLDNILWARGWMPSPFAHSHAFFKKAARDLDPVVRAMMYPHTFNFRKGCLLKNLPRLLKGIKDANSRIRSIAYDRLADFFSYSTVHSRSKRFTAKVRRLAIPVLKKEMVRVFQHGVTEQNCSLIRVIAWFDEPAYMKRLYAAVRSTRPIIRIAALNGLARRLGEPRAFDIVRRCAHSDPHGRVRETALLGLKGDWTLDLFEPDPRRTEALLQALQDPEPPNRVLVVESLSRRLTPEIRRRLEEAQRNEKDEEVLREMAKTLQQPDWSKKSD